MGGAGKWAFGGEGISEVIGAVAVTIIFMVVTGGGLDSRQSLNRSKESARH
jgi:hypothetical protein